MEEGGLCTSICTTCGFLSIASSPEINHLKSMHKVKGHSRKAKLDLELYHFYWSRVMPLEAVGSCSMGTFFHFNMKQARPWMLANLKIICQFHAHPVHQHSVDIFWAKIYRGWLFYRVESSLIQSNSRCSLWDLKS